MNLFEQRKAKTIIVFCTEGNYNFVMTPHIPFKSGRYKMRFRGAGDYEVFDTLQEFTDEKLLVFFYFLSTEKVDVNSFYKSELADEKYFQILRRDLVKSKVDDLIKLVIGDKKNLFEMIKEAIKDLEEDMTAEQKEKFEKLIGESPDELPHELISEIINNVVQVFKTKSLILQLKRLRSIDDLFHYLGSSHLKKTILELVEVEINKILIDLLRII